MNESQIHIYLNDHLALMHGEVELIRRYLSSNHETPIEAPLISLPNDVSGQCSVVSDVLHRTGGRISRAKRSAVWLLEKVGRLKLNGSVFKYSNLSRIVELETLLALAQSRVAIWDTLDVVSVDDRRLQGITFAHFREQTEEHRKRIDDQRKTAVSMAFPKPVTIRVSSSG